MPHAPRPHSRRARSSRPTPRTGSRATPRGFARTIVGALAAATVLAGSLAAGVLPPAGAGAAELPIRAAEEPAPEPAGPELIVAPLQAVLEPDAEAYEFIVLVRNPTEEPMPEGTLRLRLGAGPLADAEELAALASAEVDEAGGAGEDAGGEDGSGAGAATWQGAAAFVETTVPQTGAGEDQSLTVEVPRDELPLLMLNAPGVYPVRAELQSGAETGAPEPVVATTTVVWRGVGIGERLPLTVVVPLVLPREVRTMPTRDDLSSAVPRFDALLTAAERWGATLAVDPRVIAGIRAYGDAAPQDARDFLDRLSMSGLPIFMLQFADADPAVQAALGFDELLSPTGLAYVTRFGTFETEPAGTAGDTGDTADAGTGNGDGGADTETGPDAVPDADAAPEEPEDPEEPQEAEEPDPDEPAAPSLAELLSWPRAEPGAWPADGQVDAATLDLLKRSGIERLVLESGNVTGAATSRAQVAGFDALIADGGLGDAARRALGDGATGEAAGDAGAAERASGLAELTARLALRAQAGEPAGTGSGPVLALDRSAVAEADAPAELLDALDALGWIDPMPAVELTPSTGELRAGESGEERTELLRETLWRSEAIDDLAPLLERPGYLTQYQRVRLLEAFATRYAAEGVDFAEVDARTRARDEDLLAGVRVVASENTQLVGASSRVPVLVHNSLPFDALVTLRVAPASAAITVPERRFPDQLVAAEGNATVLVPVQSRVSAGGSALLVQVADDADDAVYFTDSLRLTIRSSYETIMLVGLAGLAALLLGFGVWRSIRRRRSAGPGGDGNAPTLG